MLIKLLYVPFYLKLTEGFLPLWTTESLNFKIEMFDFIIKPNMVLQLNLIMTLPFAVQLWEEVTQIHSNFSIKIIGLSSRNDIETTTSIKLEFSSRLNSFSRVLADVIMALANICLYC